MFLFSKANMVLGNIRIRRQNCPDFNKPCSLIILCTACDVTLGCYDPKGNGYYKCLPENSGNPIGGDNPPGK